MIMRADLDELVTMYSDAPTYITPAESMIDRGAFLDNRGRPIVSRTPGYPAFLAAIMLLVGRDLRTILIAQTLILSQGPLMLYCLARRILPPVMAITGGLIASSSPWGAVLAGAPMSDGLFLFLLSAIFLLIRIVSDYHSKKALLGAAFIGLLTGLAVLVRPIWPFIILTAGAFLFCYGPKRKLVLVLLAVFLVCATAPVALWIARNQREAQFNGLSNIAGVTVWLYLAARVRAEATGESRYAVSKLAYQEEQRWDLALSNQEADKEKWRRSNIIFRQHPWLTFYSFVRSAFEHSIHPSPDVLRAVKLNFPGDILVLAVLWGGLLALSAYALLRAIFQRGFKDGYIDWRFLLAMLSVCGALTLTSGISFAAGSRLRAPLEAIIPLLAAAGLVGAIRAFSSNLRIYNYKQ